MARKVLIGGYFGFDNFGDEALLFVLINNLLEAGFKKEGITVLSHNPNLTSLKYKVNAKNRWNVFEVLGALFSSDALVFTGGVFQDKTSFKSFLYYFSLLYLAGLFNKTIVFYGIGIGPFQKPITQKMFNFAAKKVKLITVRDRFSANFFTAHPGILITCDPLWSVEPDYSFQSQVTKINWELPIVGVSLRRDRLLREGQLWEISDKLIRMINGMKDWQVLLIPAMPSEDLSVLFDVYDTITSKITAHERVYLIENFPDFSIQEQAGIIASCDAMISMRYHPILVALSNAKPAFGLIYDGKIRSLLDFASQSGVAFKDDINQPWSFFWQNLEHAQDSARQAKERANELHKMNIKLLEGLLQF